MTMVKKPIMLDETGKEIVAQMRTQSAMLSAIARESIKNLTSWKDIQEIVRRGFASEVFHIGDQFIVPWTDRATDKTYDVPLDIVHFGTAEVKGDRIVPAMYLQWHYSLPFQVQFDAPELEVATGTFNDSLFYYVANGEGYKLLTKNIDYVVGKTIPTTPVHYRSHIEDPTGTICQSGYNRWSCSALRKLLNARAGVGGWWEPSHIGDTEPSMHATTAGLLSGFEEDFLSVIGPVKVTTTLNTVTDAALGQTEDTFDTFFPPSIAQVYGQPQITGDDDYFEYWKQATGSATPNASYEAGKNPAYRTYTLDKKLSAHTFLRSPAKNYSCLTGILSSAGAIELHYDNRQYRCAPVCVIY